MILFLTLGLPGQGFRAKPASLPSRHTAQHLIGVKSAEPIPGIVLPQQSSSGPPVRLKIPKINVDAALEHVGLTREGEVGVPRVPTNAAWFDLSPRPGDHGSAVITGHYGRWENGQGSVFDDLDKLSKGDTLSVEDEKGAIATFVVREFRTYGPSESAPDVFASSDGKAHLNLITCAGDWIKTQKTYSKRLVVFADKE